MAKWLDEIVNWQEYLASLSDANLRRSLAAIKNSYSRRGRPIANTLAIYREEFKRRGIPMPK